MPVIHSRKIIETALSTGRHSRFEALPKTAFYEGEQFGVAKWLKFPFAEVGSFAVFVRAVCGMGVVGFAVGSTHPTELL
jgi:hypothetical protein